MHFLLNKSIYATVLILRNISYEYCFSLAYIFKAQYLWYSYIVADNQRIKSIDILENFYCIHRQIYLECGIS